MKAILCVCFWEKPEGEGEAVANGDVSSEEGGEKGTRKNDIIIITGKPERCEAAKKDLLVGVIFIV